MKAYVYGANGAEITDVAKPAPKGTQVLVKVHACGLNRADLGMTKGHVHGSAGGVGTVLGMEWAGEVAELGPDAKGVKVGDKVMGSGGAAFAEYTLADHGRLFRTPSNMNFEEAATLPVALATMHNAVVTNGALQPGQTVLIQGASSGVGLMAMQIAKLKGAKTGDRLLDRCDAPRAAEGVRRRSRGRFQRSRLGRSGAEGDRRRRRRSDRRSGLRQGRQPEPRRDQGQGPHRQCRPARRHPRRFQFRPACRAPHQLYRRHLPHPLDRGNPRDFRRGAARTSGRRWNRASCNCRSTRCLHSPTSARRSSTWKPTSTSARSCVTLVGTATQSCWPRTVDPPRIHSRNSQSEQFATNAGGIADPIGALMLTDGLLNPPP